MVAGIAFPDYLFGQVGHFQLFCDSLKAFFIRAAKKNLLSVRPVVFLNSSYAVFLVDEQADYYCHDEEKGTKKNSIL